MIYTKTNELYETVMEEINDLHNKMGSPTQFHPDEHRTSTTTGNYQTPFWDAHAIGDWEGNEADVAELANYWLDEVFAGLGLFGHGGISHYYRDDKWIEFVEQAKKIINDFHDYNAFEMLCGIEF